LEKLLQKNPNDRMPLSVAKNHPWITNNVKKQEKNQNKSQ
jgi:hypothetical protein